VKLFHKIALLLIVAAAVPIGAVGFSLLSLQERAHEAEVRARFDQTARHAAETVASEIEGKARLIGRTAAVLPWGGLQSDELRGALQLIRRQAGAAAARYEGTQGTVKDPALGPCAERRVGCDDDALAAELPARAPFTRARAEGAGAVVFSPVFTDAQLGPMLVAAMQVPGTSATPGLLALAVPLQPTGRRLDEVRGEQPVTLWLIDGDGHVIASSRPAGARTAPPASAVADAHASKDGRARRHVDGDQIVVAAFAPVGGLGWSVIVEEDAARAFASPRRMRTLTLAITGVAALLALVLASLFARRLTGALERLAGGARALARGELGARVPDDRTDELGALARTFNDMGGELEKKRAEIEGWNRELEARVEARTAELKEAQAQLVQAQKLAALGQLGAGVAHEINNPLGGVIGHVQLLLSGRDKADRDYEALQCIDEAARRASQVVQNLLRFSVQHQSPVRTTVDVNKLMRDTLSLTTALIEEQKIKLELALDPKAPRARADSGQLAQVILNLVSNARTAMKEGGTLTVSTRPATEAGENGVAIAIQDTGKGIAPEIQDKIFEPFFTTKDDWSNVGLGLSVSYRIVSEHGGRIAVDSQPGHGATFTVYLPT
jgi:two-component system, NtrC family, sensor kinase